MAGEIDQIAMNRLYVKARKGQLAHLDDSWTGFAVRGFVYMLRVSLLCRMYTLKLLSIIHKTVMVPTLLMCLSLLLLLLLLQRCGAVCLYTHRLSNEINTILFIPSQIINMYTTHCNNVFIHYTGAIS